MTILEDGKGSGYQAGVNNRNQLLVNTESETTYAASAKRGRSASGSTGLLNVTTGTTGFVYYFKNTSQTLSFRIERIVISYDGGSTNRNRSLAVSYFYGPTEPTANNDASAFANLKFGDPFVPPVTAFVWDGVGSGMTVDSDGSNAGLSFVGGPGYNDIFASGGIIVPPGGSVGAKLAADENGRAVLGIIGYFEEI